MTDALVVRLHAHVAALEQLLEVQERVASDANEKLVARTARLHALNEELASQQEELQAINEELVSQQEELQAANEELYAQQEELLVAHEELGRVHGLLRDHNVAVESEVARRTAELEAANAKLLKADRYKDEFLSVISHELRTPLNFIMGFASTVEDEVMGPLNDRQHAALQKILTGTDRMLLLVDDLLDFARLQTGKFSLDQQPTDLGKLALDVVDSLQPLAAEKGIRLQADLPATALASVDSARVAQVLTNLVGNGLKFTPMGGAVTVRVRAEGDVVVGEVSDTGVGIPAADLPRIFEKFRQLDMSNTRAAGGVGLGLSISQALVEAHGGTLEARSELGRGATFRFTLPVARGGVTHADLDFRLA